jgi:hypothetical protein
MKSYNLKGFANPHQKKWCQFSINRLNGWSNTWAVKIKRGLIFNLISLENLRGAYIVELPWDMRAFSLMDPNSPYIDQKANFQLVFLFLLQVFSVCASNYGILESLSIGVPSPESPPMVQILTRLKLCAFPSRRGWMGLTAHFKKMMSRDQPKT